MESINQWLQPQPPNPIRKRRRRPRTTGKNSCQVVPNCDQEADFPLNTPDISMSTQLSFDDLFYTPGPELEQKLLGIQHNPQPLQPPTTNFYQNVQIKQEPPYHSGLETSSCIVEDRRLSLDSLNSTGGHVKMERCHSSENTEETYTSNSPIPTTPGGANGIFPEFDPSSLEIYRDLILHHLVQDIRTTCSKLFIPTDPYQWTPDHTLIWLQEMTAQFRLGEAPLTQMYLPGRVLCEMSQDEFITAAPDSGDTLYAQLQIWKTAAEFSEPGNLMPQTPAIDLPLPVQMQYSDQSNYSRIPTNKLSSHLDDSGCGAAADWLANFDPISSAANFPSQGQGNSCSLSIQTSGSHSGGRSNACSLSVSPVAHGQLLQSPCGSDSGISTDFDDFGRETSPCGRRGVPGHSSLSSTGTGSIHLWQFIRELLDHPDQYGQCVRWLDRNDGIFKIEDSHKLARLWGQRKNRSKMNYDKLSRSLRQYYKKNIIRKTGQRQRLIYQFIPPYHLL